MESEPKTLFQHLHKELVEYQLRFVDLTMKGSGLVLLFLGWMLTSQSTRAFIAASTAARFAAISGIVVMVTAYLCIAIRMSRVSRDLGAQMDALEYLPCSYYDFRKIQPGVALAAAATVTAPAAVSIALMLCGMR